MACMHDHSCEEHDCSSDWSLYKHIDLSKVSALNEAVSGSVKSVFRAWEQRLNTSEGHPWLRDVKWDNLYETEAAYKPIVNGDLDTQNFEKFDEGENPPSNTPRVGPWRKCGYHITSFRPC